MNNRPSIRLAVVGLGNIFFSAHLPVIKHFGDVICYAIDPNPAAREKLHEIYPQAILLTDLKELPESKIDIDAAVISSPVALHAEQARWFLSRGINVLCEKPLAQTEAAAKELQALAIEHGVVLQVGYYRRFHPAYQEIIKVLADQRFGELKSVKFLGGHIDGRDGPASLMNFRLSGGGITIDIGSHMIDRLIGWFPDLKLREYFDDDRGSGLEANSLTRFEATSHGQTIPIAVIISKTIDLGYAAYFNFSKGTVICELNLGHRLKLRLPELAQAKEYYHQSELLLTKEQTFLDFFATQWLEFKNRISGQPETWSSVNDAVKTTAIIETCYRQKKTLNLPWDL